MAERGAVQPLGMFSRKPLFCLFTVAASLIVSSWFFLLGSTGSPEFIEQNLQRNEKMYSLQENHTVISRIDDNFHSESPTNLITKPLEEQMPSPSPPPPEQPPLPPPPQCDPTKPILKVFMYDLPPEFHFGLLDWKPEGNVVWPDIRTKIPSYPGGLNLQHSIEYWLTLDLLSSKFPDRTGPCTAVRVDDVNDSDVVFVPFFSSLSYNRHSKIRRPEKTSRNKVLQAKLVHYLTSQKEWKRSRGMDHVILAHHPNSMLDARMKLWPCMFILSDFGRYPPSVANVDKDVIAPYRHVIKSFINDSSGFDDRPILLYFQGAIYRKDGGFVRQELFYLLRGEKDVHFTFGSVQGNGINKASQGMHSSKFCLNIAGDTPSSNRLFDAIASHCVPVIISDEIELPYEDVLDYSEFCIFVRTSDAVKKGFLIKMIRGISRERWTQMWEKLKEVEGYFEFQYPSTKDDAIQMIWQALARKVPLVRRKLHKSWRFRRRLKAV